MIIAGYLQKNHPVPSKAIIAMVNEIQPNSVVQAQQQAKAFPCTFRHLLESDEFYTELKPDLTRLPSVRIVYCIGEMLQFKQINQFSYFKPKLTSSTLISENSGPLKLRDFITVGGALSFNDPSENFVKIFER